MTGVFSRRTTGVRSRRIVRILLSAATLVALPVFAQTDRSGIAGTVLDPSGQGIPNAVAVAKDADTGAERTTRSNARGVYELYDLPVGTWDLTFSAPGFGSLHYENIVQFVGQARTLNPTLPVASTGEQITVTESVPDVAPTTATLGQAIDQSAIEDLPLNGRNWTSLTALTPGAIDQGGSTQRSIRFTGRGRDEMNITYDGVDATGIVNQAQKAYVRLAIPVSAIAEFRVDTVLPTAETGDASGAQIIVASPSGGNRYTGSVFEFFRNSDFDARSPFDLTKGPLPFHLNQFGGNVGGPIKKNKTFFFVNFEAIRQVQDLSLLGFVPTAAVRSTVLSQAPALAPVISDYPVGNGAVVGTGIQQWNGVGGSFDNEYSETIRLDHRFTDSTTAFVRFSYDNATTIAPLGSLTDRQLNSERPLNGIAELLHVFSPTFVNDFKFGTNQMVSHAFNLTPFSYAVNVSGYSGLNASQTTNQDGRTWSFIDNISLVRGRHIIKAGVEVRPTGINEGNSFTGTLTYNSLADFESNNLDTAAYTALLPLKRMRKTVDVRLCCRTNSVAPQPDHQCRAALRVFSRLP